MLKALDSKGQRLKFGCIIVACLLLTSCNGGDNGASEQVDQLIKKHLELGDSSLEIESFLKDNEVMFTYDKYAKRYQCIIRDASSDGRLDSAIVIYLYVDEQKRFTRSEVIESFTSP